MINLFIKLDFVVRNIIIIDKFLVIFRLKYLANNINALKVIVLIIIDAVLIFYIIGKIKIHKEIFH